MRIAYVLQAFPVLSETFVLNQLTGLLDRGHDVTVFASRPPGGIPTHPDVERYGLMARTRYWPDARARWGRRALHALMGAGVPLSSRWRGPHMPTLCRGASAMSSRKVKPLGLSHRRLLTPRRQSATGSALASQTVRNDMQQKTSETVNGPYTFYPESGADLTTSEGRIEWFCAHFEVEKPNLKYDEDEPDQILLTDDLMDWIRRVGASMDWLLCGAVGPVLAAYRKLNRQSRRDEFESIAGKMDEAEQKILLAGLSMAAESDLDFGQVIELTFQKIQEHRQK